MLENTKKCPWDVFKCLVLSNQSIRQDHQPILTMEKLEPSNVYKCCMKNYLNNSC